MSKSVGFSLRAISCRQTVVQQKKPLERCTNNEIHVGSTLIEKVYIFLPCPARNVSGPLIEVIREETGVLLDPKPPRNI